MHRPHTAGDFGLVGHLRQLGAAPRRAASPLKRSVLRGLLALAGCWGVAQHGAQAHPHVWVDYSTELVGQGSVVRALAQRWVFAKSFPVSVVLDPTRLPKAGPLDAQTTALFKAQAFDALQSADYFSHLYVDGQAQHFAAPTQFAVTIENDKVVYNFVLPLRTPVDLLRHSVALGTWDDSFFVDYEPRATAAVTYAPGMAGSCRASLARDHEHPIFGGVMFPLAATLTCASTP
jgi:ABC-type uncharacterized transport system substrate-binding protein